VELTATSSRTERIEVAPSPLGGRGVFARRRFEPDELIEACPVVVIPSDEVMSVCTTTLGHYVYEWDDGVAMALGYGSLYNHAYAPNARYERDDDPLVLCVVASQVIEAGEEVLIDYTGGGELELWFTPS
jgi:SET domain-containing protein